MTEQKPAPAPTVSPEQQRKARITFLAIIALFFVPYFVVPLLFDLDTMGQTNKGKLIVPHIPVASLGLQQNGVALAWDALPQQWRLVYVLPPQCDKQCENALFVMRQARLSLDRDIPRVSLLIVHTELSTETPAQLTDAESYPGATLVEALADNINSALGAVTENPVRAGHIYLMAPDGQIFLWHPSYADPNEAIVHGEELRSDLKKTLKGSMI